MLNGRTLFDSEKKINLIPQKRKVGYMFQDYALFPNMTVEKNIMAGMGKKPEKAIVQDYIRRFRLEGLEHHLPRQLSGGQKQRVAIARALAMEPEILLFDEPTSALDPQMVGEVLEVMRDLAHEGLTMIIVTHEMAFARDVADQVVFMDGGVIVEQGDARQVIEHPREERTRQFLARYSEN